MVADAPSFSDIHAEIEDIINNRHAIIYNAQFDYRLMAQSAEAAECSRIVFSALCMMAIYSAFKGEWDHSHEHYRWHRLKGGDHSALGDCEATLRLIEEVASDQPV